MSHSFRILVIAHARRITLAGFGVVLPAALAACGQPGALYLPTDPAAANRATLPQTLLPKAATPSSTAQPPGQGSSQATP